MDPYEPAPHDFRALFKRHQKATLSQLVEDDAVFDEETGHAAGFLPSIAAKDFLCSATDFTTVTSDFTGANLSQPHHSIRAYEHPGLPGLLIYPSLLPIVVQTHLLDCLLHRDLSNAQHKTNLHLHHALPYNTLDNNPSASISFFSSRHPQTPLLPNDATIHKPIALRTALESKLHWATLGGQYDWTNKQYPGAGTADEPPFPIDIGGLISGLFPAVVPQAAILNVYGARDTLGPHRDVAESCARPLVSVSIGCDAVFVAGLSTGPTTGATTDTTDAQQPETKSVVLRLRSGDVVIMSGRARYAWHAVPKVLSGTCPPELAQWPCSEAGGSEGEFEAWRGWLAGKRINLNVRQMYDAV